MAINTDVVGTKGDEITHTWESKDSILYALGVGAGTDDLAFTTENSANIDQRALPTMGVTLTEVSGVFSALGSFNPFLLVHGSQRLVCHEEIPPAGEVTYSAEITGLHDKGKGTLVEVTATAVDVASGTPMFTNVMTAFLRGEGGWGGDPGPKASFVLPEGDPDVFVEAQTESTQALLYRLAGDRNPLHSDPTFAQLGGFDRPILHGLCTFGFAGRALLEACCDNDPARFGEIEGRFSSPVFPGERLTTKVWNPKASQASYQTLGEDGRVVIDHGRFAPKTA